MGLVTCPDCGNEVSDAAPSCPTCGRPAFPAPPTQAAAATPMGDDATVRMLLPVGRSGWAIAAGYLGLISVAGFPGPLAVLCGIIAIVDIRQHPERHGMGRAIFGIVMGMLGTAILVFMLPVLFRS